MRSLLGIELDKAPFECFGIKAEFEVVRKVGDREIKDAFLPLASAVDEIDLFDVVDALVPLHAARLCAALGEGDHNVYRIIEDGEGHKEEGSPVHKMKQAAATRLPVSSCGLDLALVGMP